MSGSRFLAAAAAALLLSVLSGCSASDSSASALMGAPGMAAADSGATGAVTSITFAEPRIVLIPGQTRRLSLEVAPATPVTVRLALVGAAGDAYLDASEVVTDTSGAATFTLTAPSSPSTFSVRASVGSLSAELLASPVTGTTTLDIVPAYSGHRKITSWVGTVTAGGGCDPAVVPPPDGALSNTAPDHPRVAEVPLGTALTVTVRAGHFAGGCIELSSLVASQAKPQRSVSVPVVDRPLSTASSSVPLRLGIDTSAAWIDTWDALTVSMQSAFSPGTGTDASALLDAMHAATPASSQQDFTVARTLGAWDGRLAVSLGGDLGRRGLRAAVKRWVSGVLPALADSALSGTLSSSGAGVAALEVTSVGGASPADVGFPGTITGVSWSASPDDHVVFGGTTPAWNPAELAAALALAPAQADFPAATTVPAALSALLPCDDVATLLVGSTGLAYSACNAACVKKRCETALGAMWSRAGKVDTSATLEISGSATVTSVADDATPSDFEGTWVGDLRVGAATTHVGGPAVGGSAATAAP